MKRLLIGAGLMVWAPTVMAALLGSLLVLGVALTNKVAREKIGGLWVSLAIVCVVYLVGWWQGFF